MEQAKKQIDIKDPVVTIETLLKLALDEQKNVTFFLAQMQQAQSNVAAIEAEIQKRIAEKEAKDEIR